MSRGFVAIRLAIGILAFTCAMICIFIGNLAQWRMVEDVNRKLPRVQQFGFLGWHFRKTRRLWMMYRELYPSGPLLLRSKLSALGAFLFLTTAAVCAAIR